MLCREMPLRIVGIVWNKVFGENEKLWTLKRLVLIDTILCLKELIEVVNDSVLFHKERQ